MRSGESVSEKVMGHLINSKLLFWGQNFITISHSRFI